MAIKPTVIDISHHQDLEVDAFAKMKAAGIKGIIHKATEGTGNVDNTYAKRRAECEAAGLLWGSYHFARGGSPDAQVDHFLRYAKPTSETLLALDWEDKAMTAAKARRFLETLMARTGRRPDQIWLYTGHVGKELIKSNNDKAFFGKFPLWLCHYTSPSKLTLPSAWESYGLWQYSDKGNLVGIKRGGSVDLNVFGGKNLSAEWAAGAKPLIKAVPAAKEPTTAPSVAARESPAPVAPKDLMPVSRKAWRATWVVRAIHGVWVSLTFDRIMEWFGIAQQTRQQVETFVSEHAVALVISGALVGALAIKGIINLMADDVNEGRSVPSGGLPGT